MRKRKFLIGTAATLALSVGISGVAHAAGTLNGQTIDAVVNSGKQDKKKPGPMATFTINVDTQYTGTTAPFDNKASNTKVDFPKDWSFFDRSSSVQSGQHQHAGHRRRAGHLSEGHRRLRQGESRRCCRGCDRRRDGIQRDAIRW